MSWRSCWVSLLEWVSKPPKLRLAETATPVLKQTSASCACCMRLLRSPMFVPLRSGKSSTVTSLTPLSASPRATSPSLDPRAR